MADCKIDLGTGIEVAEGTRQGVAAAMTFRAVPSTSCYLICDSITDKSMLHRH